MAREIPKAYEPQEIERRWAQAWFDDNLYRADSSHSGQVFSIAIPPPNVTGSIHIGHMLEHTQIDILVRWRRMSGRRTLWLPGIDHAGIATQVVVERQLAKEGLKREQIGRDEFERRVWQWKAESGGSIKKQMIRLGVSCDWTRERFTLDPPMYRAVMEAFLRLYREGLIYRGRYMVNWCPRCKTALSDLEVVHESREGRLWYIRYPLAGSSEFIVVATTRPETMLGDTAVAVHPDDDRYKSLVGKKAILPLMNREIPIIADDIVDREFGTGAVKVTPAHDPNDFAMGQRHKLARLGELAEIEVIDADARMTPAAGPYAGLDRFAAREKIVEDLKSQGLLDRVTNYSLSAAICDRCKTIVEPRLSVQWFCKMKPLAEPAIQVVRDGLIPVVPENQKKVFLDWLTNIRDWCISRQLWWGHRIPIWHCADCNAMTPARDSRVEIINGHAQIASVPEKCAKCGGSKLTQDPDVLDTWFSSALWPFSTLGWPDDTPDLRTFYPTSLMISGYDILFFWDARMVMMGLHLMPQDEIEQRIPFRQLYVHAIVRDPHGMKMSKTRGNVVDPLEIIEKHGTDALRFALTVMAAPGTDIALSEERILGYRAFANKIWNAARFLFFNLEKIESAGVTLEELASPEVRAKAPYPTCDSLVHRWIFSRLAAVTNEINEALENFRFHEAAHVIYHFFWGDFCDWYIEWLKPQLARLGERASQDRDDAIATWRNLFAAFEYALRLLHPFMPFLTEELWHKLPQPAGAKSISLEPFPLASPPWKDVDAEQSVQQLREIIVAARNLRAELKVEQRKSVPAYFSASDGKLNGLVDRNAATVKMLANLSDLNLMPRAKFPSGLQVRSAPSFDFGIVHQETIDESAEIAKLKKEKDRIEKDLESKRQRLADQTFRSRAPAEIVRGLEATLAQREIEYQKTLDRLSQLDK
ncbi:MAG TPA: valine--tRNA ligase [Candidatus Acidoferrales bacterium]|nr:valine--tRNA ligase [Candidatus Acidoferrales bacterium]